MTITEDPPLAITEDPLAPTRVVAPAADADVGEARQPIRPASLITAWVLITIVGIAVVLVAIGPISEERDQRALLSAYRTEIEEASNQAYGLAGIEVPTEAPAAGAAVGIVDIEAIGLSRVVIEGTAPQQTRQGPGHVVGTGGPGQPGNSVIVGRRALFGGAFANLSALEPGDRILVTTAQGRTVYEVDHVGLHTITPNGPSGADAEAEAVVPDGPLTVDQVFGPSPDDRLTLITTASGGVAPSEEAVVVVARMDGQAFAPTPQGGRTPGNDGRSGTSGVSASLILALLAYVVAVAGAIWLHRNVPWRSAYLLTAPVLVALTIVVADELASILPAWS